MHYTLTAGGRTVQFTALNDCKMTLQALEAQKIICLMEWHFQDSSGVMWDTRKQGAVSFPFLEPIYKGEV